MKDSLITILRDKNSSMAEFREASEKLGCILAMEASNHLEKENIKVQTPFAEAEGVKLKNDVVLIIILRSGILLLKSFMKYFNDAKVGVVGLKRDEKTAIADLYYVNLPKVSENSDVIVLDPMIATGGSAVETLKILKESGIKEDKITFVAIISASEGIKNIEHNFPGVRMIVAQRDSELSAEKFIVPGLGDFGDRYFGTE